MTAWNGRGLRGRLRVERPATSRRPRSYLPYAEVMLPTVALLTDLWPSSNQPESGRFVLAEVEALRDRWRHVVLVPRLLAPHVHGRIWGSGVSGWQRAWLGPPAPARLLAYSMFRVPRRGETGPRSFGANYALHHAREHPALVHGHFLAEVGPAAVALAGRLGGPVVVTAHGTDARWLIEGGIQERRRREMLTACLAADRIIAVSRPIAEGLARAGVPASKVETIAMGVNADRFKMLDRSAARHALGLDELARIVLFVGRQSPAKGVEVLDRALARLDGVMCFATGRGSTVSKRITSLGYLGPDELVQWLSAADVMCLPSFAEGMPVSILEALACGTPVVATRVGGIPDQVEAGRNGFLVEPGDEDELAGALERAFATDWSREQVRASSEPFWWSALAPRIDALYKELV